MKLPDDFSLCLVIQLIISTKVSFRFAKEITLQQRNSGALTKGNHKMLWQQKTS